MNSARNYSFSLSALLLVGGVLALRTSPWQSLAATRAPQGAAKANTPWNKLEVHDPETQRVFSEISNAINMKRGILELADSNVAEHLHIQPETRTAIQSIVSQLENDTMQIVNAEMTKWRSIGGYKNGKLPRLLDASSDAQVKIVCLKRKAEDQAYNLLTADERGRWGQYQDRIYPKINAKPMIQPLDV